MVSAVVLVRSLAQELLHAMEADQKKKKEKKKDGTFFMCLLSLMVELLTLLEAEPRDGLV